jgi:hypothetical protein
MPSTFSTNLAIELIGTGEQAGTWGGTTNNNLGTLIEQAISGYVTQAITDGADTVITIPNGLTGVARNMCIEMTGLLTANRTLVVPNNRKLYFIFNNTTGGYAVTVKTSAGTGISVLNGEKVILICNGTNVVAAINSITGPATISANTASDALRINQTGAGNALVVEDSTNPDVTPVVIDTTGALLSGYTVSVPCANAQSGAAGVSPRIQTNAATVSNTTTFSAAWNVTTDSSPAVVLAKSKNATIGTHTAVVDGDVLGYMQWQGSDGVGFIRSADIRGVVDGTVGVGFVPGSLYFRTANSAGALTNRFIIGASGNIGIGTVAPVSSDAITLSVDKDIGGQPTAFSVRVQNAVQSTVTTRATSFYSAPSTAAAVFTLAEYEHFTANPIAIGAGSTVTLQVGFRVKPSFNTATNQIGFLSSVPVGSGEYNFYADTQAENIFYGPTRFGGVTTPVAAVDVTGNVAATTTILSSGPTSGIGYGTGAGGAVTQITNRTTPVTLNKVAGQITLVSATTTVSTFASFTVTNSAVAATDVVIVNFASGATADRYSLSVTAVAAGSFRIQIHNIVAVAVAEAPVINFAVIKGVAV